MRKSKKILIGLAVVFAAGAIVGVLYAPHKGKHTRKHLFRRGRSMLHAATDAMKPGLDKLHAMQDEINSSVKQFKEKLKRSAACKSAMVKDRSSN